MDIRDENDKQDKRKIEEYKKNPMANFTDSINRSTIGDPEVSNRLLPITCLLQGLMRFARFRKRCLK